MPTLTTASRAWTGVVVIVGLLLLIAVYLVKPLADGLPLTLIGVLAVVIVLAWLGGGVGPAPVRHFVGVVWLSLLVGCWGFALSRLSADAWWVLALVFTAAAFLLPTVWRRMFRRVRGEGVAGVTRTK